MKSLANQCRSLAADARGGVLIMTAISMLLLIGLSGAAIDFGRYILVQMRVQQAADAAALAVAAMPVTASTADKQAAITRYFSLNYPTNYVGVNITAANLSSVTGNAGNNNTTSVTLTGYLMPTVFVKLLGLDHFTINSSNQIQLINSAASTIYDIVFVLDTSGSMAADDVGAINPPGDVPAGNVATVLQDAKNYCNAKSPLISTFPHACDLIEGSGHVTATTIFTGLQGASRINALRSAAHTFITNLLTNSPTSTLAAATFNTSAGPSLAPTSNAVSATNFIDSLFAWGATNSYDGFVEAQTLLPAAQPGHVRVIIYITDGINTVAESGSFKYYPATYTVHDNELCDGSHICEATNNKTLPICSSMKADGVQIYTLAFGSDINDGSAPSLIAQTFLQNCASTAADGTPNFFIAPDATTLSAQFNAILVSIKKIKIIL